MQKANTTLHPRFLEYKHFPIILSFPYTQYSEERHIHIHRRQEHEQKHWLTCTMFIRLLFCLSLFLPPSHLHIPTCSSFCSLLFLHTSHPYSIHALSLCKLMYVCFFLNRLTSSELKNTNKHVFSGYFWKFSAFVLLALKL